MASEEMNQCSKQANEVIAMDVAERNEVDKLMEDSTDIVVKSVEVISSNELSYETTSSVAESVKHSTEDNNVVEEMLQCEHFDEKVNAKENLAESNESTTTPGQRAAPSDEAHSLDTDVDSSHQVSSDINLDSMSRTTSNELDILNANKRRSARILLKNSDAPISEIDSKPGVLWSTIRCVGLEEKKIKRKLEGVMEIKNKRPRISSEEQSTSNSTMEQNQNNTPSSKNDQEKRISLLTKKRTNKKSRVHSKMYSSSSKITVQVTRESRGRAKMENSAREKTKSEIRRRHRCGQDESCISNELKKLNEKTHAKYLRSASRSGHAKSEGARWREFMREGIQDQEIIKRKRRVVKATRSNLNIKQCLSDCKTKEEIIGYFIKSLFERAMIPAKTLIHESQVISYLEERQRIRNLINGKELVRKMENLKQDLLRAFRENPGFIFRQNKQKIISYIVKSFNSYSLSISLDAMRSESDHLGPKLGDRLVLTTSITSALQEYLFDTSSDTFSSSKNVLCKLVNPEASVFYKCMYLIYLLENVKINKILKTDPPLINKMSKFKRIVQILMELRDMMFTVQYSRSHSELKSKLTDLMNQYFHYRQLTTYEFHNSPITTYNSLFSIARLEEYIRITKGKILKLCPLKKCNKNDRGLVGLKRNIVMLNSCGFSLSFNVNDSSTMKEKNLKLLWEIVCHQLPDVKQQFKKIGLVVLFCVQVGNEIRRMREVRDQGKLLRESDRFEDKSENIGDIVLEDCGSNAKLEQLHIEECNIEKSELIEVEFRGDCVLKLEKDKCTEIIGGYKSDEENPSVGGAVNENKTSEAILEVLNEGIDEPAQRNSPLDLSLRNRTVETHDNDETSNQSSEPYDYSEMFGTSPIPGIGFRLDPSCDRSTSSKVPEDSTSRCSAAFDKIVPSNDSCYASLEPLSHESDIDRQHIETEPYRKEHCEQSQGSEKNIDVLNESNLISEIAEENYGYQDDLQNTTEESSKICSQRSLEEDIQENSNDDKFVSDKNNPDKELIDITTTRNHDPLLENILESPKQYQRSDSNIQGNKNELKDNGQKIEILEGETSVKESKMNIEEQTDEPYRTDDISNETDQLTGYEDCIGSTSKNLLENNQINKKCSVESSTDSYDHREPIDESLAIEKIKAMENDTIIEYIRTFEDVSDSSSENEHTEIFCKDSFMNPFEESKSDKHQNVSSSEDDKLILDDEYCKASPTDDENIEVTIEAVTTDKSQHSSTTIIESATLDDNSNESILNDEKKLDKAKIIDQIIGDKSPEENDNFSSKSSENKISAESTCSSDRIPTPTLADSTASSSTNEKKTNFDAIVAQHLKKHSNVATKISENLKKDEEKTKPFDFIKTSLSLCSGYEGLQETETADSSWLDDLDSSTPEDFETSDSTLSLQPFGPTISYFDSGINHFSLSSYTPNSGGIDRLDSANYSREFTNYSVQPSSFRYEAQHGSMDSLTNYRQHRPNDWRTSTFYDPRCSASMYHSRGWDSRQTSYSGYHQVTRPTPIPYHHESNPAIYHHYSVRYPGSSPHHSIYPDPFYSSPSLPYAVSSTNFNSNTFNFFIDNRSTHTYLIQPRLQTYVNSPFLTSPLPPVETPSLSSITHDLNVVRGRSESRINPCQSSHEFSVPAASTDRSQKNFSGRPSQNLSDAKAALQERIKRKNSNIKPVTEVTSDSASVDKMHQDVQVAPTITSPEIREILNTFLENDSTRIQSVPQNPYPCVNVDFSSGSPSRYCAETSGLQRSYSHRSPNVSHAYPQQNQMPYYPPPLPLPRPQHRPHYSREPPPHQELFTGRG